MNESVCNKIFDLFKLTSVDSTLLSPQKNFFNTNQTQFQILLAKQYHLYRNQTILSVLVNIYVMPSENVYLTQHCDLLNLFPGPGVKGCPRCSGVVYAAEQVLSKGTPFHARCLSCAVCRTGLDRSSYLPGMGTDTEVYCKVSF